MRKAEMITEINKIVGYEVIPAWELFTYENIKEIYTKIKTGKYKFVLRGDNCLLVRKESED